MIKEGNGVRELTPQERIAKGIRDGQDQHRGNVHQVMGEEIGRLLMEAHEVNKQHRNYWDFNSKARRDKKIAALRQKYEPLVEEIEQEIRAADAQHDPIFMKSVRDHLAFCDQEFESNRGRQLSPMGARTEFKPK